MDTSSLLKLAKDTLSAYDHSTSDWCIAGGAVRDSLIGVIPQDIDVYQLGMPISDRGPQVEYKISDELVLQVMHSSCKTAEELIKTFDWNICVCALLPNGQVINPHNVDDIIEQKLPLQLVNMTNPWSNLRRGYRFSDRYGLNIPTEELLRLFKACSDTRRPACIDTMENEYITFDTETMYNAEDNTTEIRIDEYVEAVTDTAEIIFNNPLSANDAIRIYPQPIERNMRNNY